MKLYTIKDWAKFYEASDNRKTDGPLSWVSVRTKTDGLGFRRMAAHKNRSELFAVWHLLVGLAAKQHRADRGKLARNGIPLTPADMELMTGWPAKSFSAALDFFSSQEQQWLEVATLSDLPRTESDKTGQHPISPGQTPPTLPTLHTNIQTVGTAGAAPARFRAPALDEWLAHADEIKWPRADAEGAFDHYQACGWTIGAKSKPMKDWRAAAKNCQRRNLKSHHADHRSSSRHIGHSTAAGRTDF